MKTHVAVQACLELHPFIILALEKGDLSAFFPRFLHSEEKAVATSWVEVCVDPKPIAAQAVNVTMSRLFSKTGKHLAQ